MIETLRGRPNQGLPSADSLETTGARTPADALGKTKRMSQSETGGQEPTDCPTCGDTFDSTHGMRIHHSRVHGVSIAYTDRECEYCGRLFTVKRSEVKRGNGRFCSSECFGKQNFDGDTLERECVACGEAFMARKARVDRGEARYCSMVCYHGDRDSKGDAPRTCKQCGEEFTVPATQLDHRPARFCSLDCSGAWTSEHRTGEDHHLWEGGRAPYGRGWNEQKKEEVRDRDGRQCQRCGMDEAEHMEIYGQKLDVHHLVPAREFDDPEERNAKENLVTLCRGCHPKWEGIPLRPEVI